MMIEGWNGMFSCEMGKEFGQIRYIWDKLIYQKGNLVANPQIRCERFFFSQAETISKHHKNRNTRAHKNLHVLTSMEKMVKVFFFFLNYSLERMKLMGNSLKRGELCDI